MNYLVAIKTHPTDKDAHLFTFKTGFARQSFLDTIARITPDLVYAFAQHEDPKRQKRVKKAKPFKKYKRGKK